MDCVSKKKKQHNFTYIFLFSFDVAKANFAWQLDRSHFTLNFGQTGGFVELLLTSFHFGYRRRK